MRSRFRRGPDRVFTVDLTVHRLESIPEIHRLLYVQWRTRKAFPAEGRTPSSAVEPGNLIRWNTDFNFSITIPADPTDLTVLQPAPITFQLRSEQRTRWVGRMTYQDEGKVELDLAEVAAIGYLSRNYLVQDTRLNTTLKLSIRVTHRSGDKIFRTRTLPQLASATLLKSSTPSTPTPPSASAVDCSIPPLFPDNDNRDTPNSRDTRVGRPSAETFIDPLNASADRLAASAPESAMSSMLPPSVSGAANASSASMNSSALFSLQENDNTASLFDLEDSPARVLERSIPNPEKVQKAVYERVLQDRIRDEWPAHIVASRYDASEIVNYVYSTVCAADGIGVIVPTADPLAARETRDAAIDKKTSLPLSTGSIDDGPQAGPVTQMLLTRKPSMRNSKTTVRSNSMGDLEALAALSH